MEKSYGPRQLKKVTGITYRQLNDWESKGLIPATRDGEAKWRKFSASQFFGLMILSEIRKRFDVRLEDLQWLGSILMEEGGNRFFLAAGRIAFLGMPLFVLTDLKTVLEIDTIDAISDFMSKEEFGRKEEGGFILLRLNSLVKKLVSELKVPVELPEHGFGYELRKDRRAQTPEEEKLLKLVRGAVFEKVEVSLASGTISLISASQSFSKATLQEVQKMIDSSAFQVVEIAKADGAIVRLQRKLTFKPEEKKQK